MDLILGAPRRRWAPGEKLAAVAATFSPGVTVTTVARELGISRCMLFAWRTITAKGGHTPHPGNETKVEMLFDRAINLVLQPLKKKKCLRKPGIQAQVVLMTIVLVSS